MATSTNNTPLLDTPPRNNAASHPSDVDLEAASSAASTPSNNNNTSSHGVSRRKLDSRLRSVTKSWREIALGWQKQNAPLTSYERLVRASVSEVPAEERAAIRRDIHSGRAQPTFSAAPWLGKELDQAAHYARLERVLCAWTQYDQEIGYVQAMNLIGSTLLLLLDGDEEGTFWVLVTLLRQLPAQFYSRASPQLLGFWTEVEVLSQLAGRLLGLGSLRNALHQVAPRWMLEFWLGTLPLETIVLIWDHMLRNANAHANTPSVLGLQVSLVLLSHVKPRLEEVLSSVRTSGDEGSHAPPSPTDEVAFHQAFTILQSIRVPDASAGSLLLRAQRVRLNVAAVQDMRLQLRMAIVDKCSRTGATLPFAEPLPEAGSKPLPLIVQPQMRFGSLGQSVPCSHISAAHGLALIIALGGFVGSTIVWGPLLQRTSTDTEVAHLDALILLGLAACGVGVGWRWRQARSAVALGSCLIALFLGARAISTLIDCSHGGASADGAAVNATSAAGGKEDATSAPPSPPPPLSPDGCVTLHALWPVVVCLMVALVGLLQIGLACAAREEQLMRDTRETSLSFDADPAELARGAIDPLTLARASSAARQTPIGARSSQQRQTVPVSVPPVAGIQ